MKIVVCIKQVPDTNEVKLDPKTNRLIRDCLLYTSNCVIENYQKGGIPSEKNQDFSIT